MSYRNLNATEIASLEKQGCRAEDWSRVSIAEPVVLERIQNVRFSGEVRIGSLQGTASFAGGVVKPCGLYDSLIHECTLGKDVYISRVSQLANYDVEEGVVVENVGSLVVDGTSSFGNGVELEILNEGGGRPLKIYDRLSSQIAYFLVLYRHNEALVKKLEALIDAYVQSRTSTRGKLGKACRIVNCGTLTNLAVGPHAILTGAFHLADGTVGSCVEDPAMVGAGVVAKKFIILSGSRVEDAAMLSSCFVGQGVRIGKQYSAENSAFFANCEGFHGEACSVFAGPYTVTHHKSTLMIAGLFSFYNAGSGTNQSNHMYKLGPVHQGILERGSKTGSFSYLLWPCRVGAFSVVMGKHYANFDASNLPFSYINEEEGKSVITPAMNLFTVGTRRDSAKWPARDRRKDPDKLDLIHFELFNPYLVGKILAGMEDLRNMYESASKKLDILNYKGISIRRLMLKTCIKYYDLAVRIYLGEKLIAWMKASAGAGKVLEQFKASLKGKASSGLTQWVDVCGLLAPAASVETLLSEIEGGKIKDVAQLESKLKDLYAGFKEEEWKWYAALLEARTGVKIEDLTTEQLEKIITEWRDSSVKLNNMILQDAQKEFDPGAQIGFGVDGDEEVKKQDFEAVRGSFEGNKFVKELRAESEKIAQIAQEMIAQLQ